MAWWEVFKSYKLEMWCVDNLSFRIPGGLTRTETSTFMADLQITSSRTLFECKDLANKPSCVLNAPKKALQPPYSGTYPVTSWTSNTYIVYMQGADVTVSLDRLDPTCVIAHSNEDRSSESTPFLPQDFCQILNLISSEETLHVYQFLWFLQDLDNASDLPTVCKIVFREWCAKQF